MAYKTVVGKFCKKLLKTYVSLTLTATCSSYLILHPEKFDRILYWLVRICKLLMTWICSLLLSHLSCNYSYFLVMTHGSHEILQWDLGIEVKPAISSLSYIWDSPKNRGFFLPNLPINCIVLQKKKKVTCLPKRGICKSVSILFQLNLCDWAFWVYGKQINGSGC